MTRRLHSAGRRGLAVGAAAFAALALPGVAAVVDGARAEVRPDAAAHRDLERAA